MKNHGRESDQYLQVSQSLSLLILWLRLTRTGNYQIYEFDWLKYEVIQKTTLERIARITLTKMFVPGC